MVSVEDQTMLLESILIAVSLIALTVAIHAFGTTYWIRYLLRRYGDGEGHFRAHATLLVVTLTALVLLTFHIIQVTLWALVYLFLVPDNQLMTLEAAVYFSVVTFTTLGYGDITLQPEWRLLSGVEALNGALLVGWTTAFFFLIIQRSWQSMARSRTRE
jgi:hypothetical protein